MTTIEITVETLDELVMDCVKIIDDIENLYWRQLHEDEDLSIVLRGPAGKISAEDALRSFQEVYLQHFTEKYNEWEGVNPWKAAVKDFFDFRTDTKRKLKRQGMIALAALWVAFWGYPNRPPTPKLGVGVAGAGEGFAYLDTYDVCKKKEQFYYDLVNASISVEEVTVSEVE